MAKPANPIAKIATKLAALQSKSSKLNDEIVALSKMVADEAKKADAVVPAKTAKPVVAKSPAKKAAAKPAAKKPATKKK